MEVARHHARLASGCWPSFAGRDSLTRRVATKGFRVQSLPPFLSLPDAMTPKLWTVLETAKPGDASLLPAASALASYAPDDGKWEAVGGKVAQALVSVNSLLLRPWIEALRPVHNRLMAPLDTIFRDKSRPESVHSLATDILTDYASDDPDRLAELLIVSDPKAYAAFSPSPIARSQRPCLCSRRRYRRNQRIVVDPAPRPILDHARLHAHRQDRIGSGDARRAPRLLPDDASGRVPHNRRGSPPLGLSSHPVPPLRRGQNSPGCGGLDP